MKKLVLFLLLLSLVVSPAVTQAKKDKKPPLGSRSEGILCTDHFPARPARTKSKSAARSLEQMSSPLYPLEDTFLLHSYPSSDQKLLIDFDGFDGVVNNYTAYDTDGDPSTFSEAELTEIQKIWYCASEYFLPFNIDVTTEDEGISPIVGQRCVVDGSGQYTYSWAYFGDWARSNDREAYVAIYDGTWIWIAPTIGHEIGHTLNLNHDGNPSDGEYYGGHGTGDTQWSPIMGWSCWSLNQWDDGEYFGTTNPNQDDLATIDAVSGVDYRPDDHGSTTGTATGITFTAASLEFAAEGIIGQRSDVDYFSFTTAVDGNVQFSISEDVVIGASSLDLVAKIHDSGGAVLYTSNPVDKLYATFDVTLGAGDYYLSIDGVGMGDPTTNPPTGYTDYGSLGYYSILALGPANNDPDVTAPTPDQMTWETVPYETGAHSIAMEASVATDTENGVEYKFTCTAGGGNDSGWQSGTSYTDTSLPAGIQYTYTVTARDTSDNRNPTAASAPASATTDPEYDTPTPDPMTWATAPYPKGPSSIVMVATTASDLSGVEYFFDCTAGGGNNSEWQDSATYEDTGLAASTEYTYTVTARDKSGAQNTTATSGPASASTSSDTNIVLPANGGVLESYTSQYSGGYAATMLTNGNTNENGWCSTDNPSSPQEFVYSFDGGQDATLDLAVIHAGLAEERYFSKDVEVWTSANGTDFTLAGSGVLVDQPLNSISIPLGSVTAKKVKLSITSGYSSGWWELAEFEVYGEIGGCSTCGDLDGSGGNVDPVDFGLFAACWGENPSINSSCACANLVEFDDDIIDLLDFSVFAELFLSSSSNYPPNCSTP